MVRRFLRMGVACAVFDESGAVLLSKRGDLGVWNLPGGRLDAGELLEVAAAREVREETGIEAVVESVAGMYFSADWGRLTVLYRAKAVGGSLFQQSYETRESRFFTLHDLPQDNFHQYMLDDLMNDVKVPLRVIRRPKAEIRVLKRKFAWRWVQNLLSGHPEPRYPRFKTWAAWKDQERVRCSGSKPPWEHLVPAGGSIKLYEIRQDAATIEFIFMK